MTISSILVVAIFAIVQSIFGVGLLVFGTPTLLLLGYSFSGTLAVLLPASLTISVLQIWSGPPIERRFISDFILFCLAPLAAALSLVLLFAFNTSVDILVAILLAIFAALRMSPATDLAARNWVERHQKRWLVLMGVIHGLSNLGGGLLTILAAARYRDKTKVRHLIAFCYSSFAAIQLAMLATFSTDVMGPSQAVYAALAGLVYLVAGRHVFARISAPIFHHLFTALMASYAILLGLKVANLL